MVTEEGSQMLLIADEVGKVFGMLEGKFQGGQCMVEAQQAYGAGKLPRCPQQRKRVGRRAEADIPDDELARMLLQSFDQPKLADVERFGFRHGADDGVKGLMVRKGVDAVRAIAEFDYSVTASV